MNTPTDPSFWRKASSGRLPRIKRDKDWYVLIFKEKEVYRSLRRLDVEQAEVSLTAIYANKQNPSPDFSIPQVPGISDKKADEVTKWVRHNMEKQGFLSESLDEHP